MFKKLILSAFLITALGLLVGASAKAFSITGEESATMGSDQTVEGPLYIAGSTVRVEGTVNGDLFCAGQTVEVSGTVNGDVLCAAQQLNLKGTVNGDVRAAAQSIQADGPISGSFTVFAQTLRLNSGGSIGRDTTLFAQTAVLDGSVGRDIVGGGSSITFNGDVGGNVKLDVQNLTLGSNANVSGGINYTSWNDANIQQGAQVTALTRTDPPAQRGAEAPQNTLAMRASSAFFWFLSALIVGGVLILVFPRLFDRTAEGVRQKPWLVFGLGLLGVFVTPILAIFLVITVIGIPLTLIMLLAWLLLLLVSGVFAGYVLGSLIMRRLGAKDLGGWQRFGYLALGTFVLAVLAVIPVINAIAGLLTVVFGVGSLLHVLSNRSAAGKLEVRG